MTPTGCAAAKKSSGLDPCDDPYKNSRWDLVTFARKNNGEEEAYLWLLRKLELGWGLEVSAGLEAGTTVNPRARISFWNRRYYLEPLGSEAQVRAGGLLLRPGQIACLGAETDISLGPLRFRWKPIGAGSQVNA